MRRRAPYFRRPPRRRLSDWIWLLLGIFTIVGLVLFVVLHQQQDRFDRPVQGGREMVGARKFLVDKINEVASFGGDPQPKGESIGDFLLEKLHQLLHIFDNLWAFIVDKLDQILPFPETLHHWIHIGLTQVLPIALVLLFLYCCCSSCCCCCKSGHGYRKMMKAPGRSSARMPRASFEGNPRGYFRNLHASKPLVY